MPEPRKKIIVEIGPGSRPVISMPMGKGYLQEKYVAIEPQYASGKKFEEALEERRKGGKVFPVKGVMEELPFKENSVDEIVMHNLLSAPGIWNEQISLEGKGFVEMREKKMEAMKVALTEIKRVLKPGGKIHVGEYSTPGFFPLEKVMEVLGALGFDKEKKITEVKEITKAVGLPEYLIAKGSFLATFRKKA